MIYLAFYKAPGDWRDALIRYATRSAYSHVELIDAGWPLVPGGQQVMAYTSSPRDGGVVVRSIRLAQGRWDLVPVPWADASAATRFIATFAGAAYDWPAIFGNHLLRLGIHSQRRWICSEIIAAALGLHRAWDFSPGGLYDQVRFLNTRLPAGS